VNSKIIVLVLLTSSAFAQWSPQKSNTTASLRGLSVVDAKVVWASGTGGTFVRTTDGGETWQPGTVPGAEKLDFRDVQAVDAKTAYLLSIGDGSQSRIYKTTDAGKNWSLQYTEQNPKAFLDCMDFWDPMHGIVLGDAVDGKFELLTTSDGGAHWEPLRPEKIPDAAPGEGSPAASGTCIATFVAQKSRKKPSWTAWFVTENASRVFHTTDSGKTWTASSTPMMSGADGVGIFSIAIVDADRVAIVGGDYRKPADASQNAAWSDDAGKSWQLSRKLPTGYRSAVAIVPDTQGPTAIAVGTTGIDYSLDHGGSWTHMHDANLNAVAFADAHHGWAVGPKGLILKYEGAAPGGVAPTLKK
jgi:photosystem II stability/assembly factor-like uncharacterized protein